MGAAASWCGALKREDNQADHVTRRHTEAPLIVWLLGVDEAQGTIVPKFSVEVKGHRWVEKAEGKELSRSAKIFVKSVMTQVLTLETKLPFPSLDAVLIFHFF